MEEIDKVESVGFVNKKRENYLYKNKNFNIVRISDNLFEDEDIEINFVDNFTGDERRFLEEKFGV